ncbi:hypothetical protein V5799_015734 [Amblyomma americanum]|uniref:Uncharacterized protein n=1 Tax=Amblyomma americanum TaxID=6943 RepID=A0AAQ4F863_AMBAM
MLTSTWRAPHQCTSCATPFSRACMTVWPHSGALPPPRHPHPEARPPQPSRHRFAKGKVLQQCERCRRTASSLCVCDSVPLGPAAAVPALAPAAGHNGAALLERFPMGRHSAHEQAFCRDARVTLTDVVRSGLYLCLLMSRRSFVCL